MLARRADVVAYALLMCITIDTEYILACTVVDMKSKRTYTMTARAEAVAATRQAILDALLDLSVDTLVSEIGLEDVASRAGVSVQTVLRHFGNRAGLMEAGIEHGRRTIAEEREAPRGDVEHALRVLSDHYERRGRSVLMMLAQEHTDTHLATITAGGRRMHRQWLTEVFDPFLPRGRTAREESLDLLVVATDVYAWKLLRLDRGLGATATRRRMQRLVGAVLAELGNHPHRED